MNRGRSGAAIVAAIIATILSVWLLKSCGGTSENNDSLTATVEAMEKAREAEEARRIQEEKIERRDKTIIMFWDLFRKMHEETKETKKSGGKLILKQWTGGKVRAWMVEEHRIVPNKAWDEEWKALILRENNLKECMFFSGFIPYSDDPEIRKKAEEIAATVPGGKITWAD